MESGNQNATTLRWRMTDSIEREYPNFSHGTAGVCSALLQLDTAVRKDRAKRNGRYDGRFIDAAIKGGEYLKSIAKIDNEQCLIFHHSPTGKDLYYLGWCHGPPGTGSFFVDLAEKTDDKEFMKLARLGAAAILKNELDKKRTPGFWNNVGQCCGTAGVASFLARMYEETGDEKYRKECRRLTEDLLKRATTVNLPNGKVGLKWIQAEHRVRPDELKAQTGLMQGAAGIGVGLLDVHALEPW